MEKRLSRLIVMVGLVLALPVFLFAQDKPKAGEKASKTQAASGEKVSLKLYFTPGNEYFYEMLDSTLVERMYSDSTVMKYTRIMKYNFTLRADADPKDGIYKVSINVDSVDYWFKQDETSIYYNTNSTKNMRLEFPDLVAATVPVNRTFTMNYSPYNEVVKCEGEMLDWLRDYIRDNNKGQLDSIMENIWLNGISNTALAHIGDIQKGVVPNGRVYKDSTWSKPLFYKSDGIDCRDDSATSKILGFYDNTYRIETTTNKFKVLPATKSRLYGIPYFVDVLGGNGNGKFNLSITAKGLPRRADAQFVTNMKVSVKREVFTQKVTTHTIWTLLGEYKW